MRNLYYFPYEQSSGASSVPIRLQLSEATRKMVAEATAAIEALKPVYSYRINDYVITTRKDFGYFVHPEHIYRNVLNGTIVAKMINMNTEADDPDYAILIVFADKSKAFKKSADLQDNLNEYIYNDKRV